MRPGERGFTLIELLVVMAIIAILAALAVPLTYRGIQRAKESALHEDLRVMRKAIDDYKADLGRYPKKLEELAQRHYLREIPEDPMTESSQTWVVFKNEEDPKHADEIVDVQSGASGNSSEGDAYASW